MVDRITLTQPCYMKVDGQWGVVDSGTVVDVPSAQPFHSSTATVQSGTGTLLNNTEARGQTLRRK